MCSRSGTVPTPLVVGLGAACEVAQEEMVYDKQHIDYLANKLIQVFIFYKYKLVISEGMFDHNSGTLDLDG